MSKSDSLDLSDLVPRLKKQGYDADSVARRRAWIEERLGVTLPHIGAQSGDPLEMRGNIENLIGAAQVPIGVAGPLLVNGDHARGRFYVPLATTEGALVRSFERGMVTLTRSGGVDVSVAADQNRICPTFFFRTTREAARFGPWIAESFEDIRREAERTTSHGRLTSLSCRQYGREVIADFGYDTADAQGMNMIVKATDAACRWIVQHFDGVGRFHVFSGLGSEKRASGFLLSQGKGKWLTAGAFLAESLLSGHLGCSGRQLVEVWRSTVIGNLAANAVGYCGQFSNGLAAIFIATGQDVANVTNSSAGITSFELLEDGGVYAAVTLPALEVATVGGGTGLGTQRECLRMLDCYGPGKALKLAEIVAAAALAGEISMGAAIASGEFANAHERYGRNRPPAADDPSGKEE